MINNANILDCLILLSKNVESFSLLKEEFPDILADLVSFQNNNNCSCKNKLINFFIEKINSDSNFFDKYIKDNDFFTKLDNLSKEKLEKNYAGRVFIIEKNESSWKQFTQSLVGKNFKMFSVAEREDTIAVYFL
jgi:hypothetical protein